MDLFGEKKYEELDTITKLVEPITWSVLDVFHKLSEQEEVPKEYILEQAGINSRIDFNDVFEKFINKGQDVPWRHRDWIRSRYTLETTGLTIDLENKTVEGKVTISRLTDEVTEKELTEILQNSGFRDRYSVSFPEDNPAAFERCREILDLIGTPVASAALKKRTQNQLSEGLYRALKDVMKNNRWNIRSVDLADKVGTWAIRYIKDGNLAAMRNFCLLKAATHRGYPLYEIDEEAL